MLTAGQTFGVNVGTQAVGAGFGLLSTLLNNRLATQRADHDREENYKYNELAAKNADNRTRALYTDLYSPQAQLHQIREAGLSPSVFYANGAGGISGSTGAQGEGASGIKTDTYGVPNIPALDMSQIQLNQSLARKNNAEANITEQTTEEQIKAFFLENTNRELRNNYMEWENAKKAIDLNLLATYGQEEMERKLELLAQQTKKLVEETRKEQINANVAEQTQKEQIEYIKNQNMQILADVMLKRSQKQLNEANVNLTDAQTKQVLESISQRWKELGINEGNLEVKRDQLEKQVEQWSIENGFRDKEQKIAIAKIVVNYIIDNKKTFVDLIDAVIPL